MPENVCDVNADCNNTAGSYNCVCKAGYSGNGTSCLSIYNSCVTYNSYYFMLTVNSKHSTDRYIKAHFPIVVLISSLQMWMSVKLVLHRVIQTLTVSTQMVVMIVFAELVILVMEQLPVWVCSTSCEK